MMTTAHKAELTSLTGNFLSKYDDTAATGVERLCMVAEQDSKKQQQQLQDPTAAAAPSFASAFLRNEQICDTFTQLLATRKKLDFGLFVGAVTALITNCSKRDRVYAVHRLCTPELMGRMRRLLSTFEPERGGRGVVDASGSKDNKSRNNNNNAAAATAVPVQHVENTMRLAIHILKYAPALLSSRLTSASQQQAAQQQQLFLATSSSGGGGGGESAGAAAATTVGGGFWQLPTDFPVLTAEWFPSWCGGVRELRAEYFLAALGHPLREIARASALQQRVLSLALQDAAGLAAAGPRGRGLLQALLQVFLAGFVTCSDISTAQKCEVLRTQSRDIPKLLAACLGIESATMLAQAAIRSMVDNVNEPLSNYTTASTSAGSVVGGSADISRDAAAMMAVDGSSSSNSGGGGGADQGSGNDAPRGRMPNFWMLVLLRALSPEKRATDATLTCYVLHKFPELYRPYIGRVSGHLLEKGEGATSVAATKVAACNALTRVLCTPLPYHLTAATVVTPVLLSSSSSSPSMMGGGGGPLLFYHLTPAAAADEVCPPWMEKFCHKMLQDPAQPVLDLVFCLQVTRAALQRAQAVRASLLRIFDHRQQQQSAAAALSPTETNNSSTKKNKKISLFDALDSTTADGGHAPASSSSSSSSSWWTAEATFMAEFDRLLHKRLPATEVIVARMQRQVLPQLSNSHDSDSNRKFQFVAQRVYTVMTAYLTAFDRPTSFLSSCVGIQQQAFQQLQLSTLSALIGLVQASYRAQVERLSRLHHSDAASAAATTAHGGQGQSQQQQQQQQQPLIADVLHWGAEAVRVLKQQVGGDSVCSWWDLALNTSSASATHRALKAVLLQVRDLLILVLQSVMIDTGSAHFSRTKREVNIWLEQLAGGNSSSSSSSLSADVVATLLLVLTTMLNHSKSKSADSVAQQLADSPFGALACAARTFVSKAQQKQQQQQKQEGAAASSSASSSSSFDALLQRVERAAPAILASRAAVRGAEQQQQQRGDDDAENDDDDGGSNEQQQQNPASVVKDWGEQCNLGIMAIAKIDAANAAAGVAPTTPLEAFLALVEGGHRQLAARMPLPSKDVCGQRCFVDVAALEKLKNPKSWRKCLVVADGTTAASSPTSAFYQQQQLPWTEDFLTVWHISALLLKKLEEMQKLYEEEAATAAEGQQEGEASKQRKKWVQVAEALLVHWVFPASLLGAATARGGQLSPAEDLHVAGCAVMLLVAGSVVASVGSGQLLEAPGQVAAAAASISQSIVGHLYGGTCSFTDRAQFALLKLLDRLASSGASLEAAAAATPGTKVKKSAGDAAADVEVVQQQLSVEDILPRAIVESRFVLGVGAAAAADAASRFPELQVLHAIFESQTETQQTAGALAAPLELFVDEQKQQQQQGKPKASRSTLFEITNLLYPELRININNQDNVTNAKFIRAATASASSGGSSSFDPRYLLPLINTVLAARSKRLIDVANYICGRALPFLLRGASCGGRSGALRRLAFNGLALCYTGLHPTRRLFVDTVRIFVQQQQRHHGDLAPTQFPRVPAATSACLVQCLAIASRPQASLFESVGHMLCKITGTATMNNNSNNPGASAAVVGFPLREALFKVSPESLVPSGAPFVDEIVIARKVYIKEKPKEVAQDDDETDEANKKAPPVVVPAVDAPAAAAAAAKPAAPKPPISAPLHRFGFHRELDATLTALRNSCSSENDFASVHSSGVLTHLLSLFHVMSDFTAQARAVLTTVVACTLAPGSFAAAASQQQQQQLRLAFSHNLLHWIVGSLCSYSNYVLGSNSALFARSRSNNNGKRGTLSGSSGNNNNILHPRISRNSTRVCNILIDALGDTLALLSTRMKVTTTQRDGEQEKEDRGGAMTTLILAMLLEWTVSPHASSVVGSARLVDVLESAWDLALLAPKQLQQQQQWSELRYLFPALQSLVSALKEATTVQAGKRSVLMLWSTVE